MSKLKLPSEFRNQPSNAAVTLAPETRRGSLGSVCADSSAAPARRTAALNRPILDRSRELTAPSPLLCNCVGCALALVGQRFILLVGQVSDVNPRVRHLIDGSVAIADPLV